MENAGSNINREAWDPNMNREAWDPNPPKSYAVSGKIMLTAIIILFAVVIFMVALHVYARWYLLRLRRRYLHRRRQRSSNPQIVFYVDSNIALPSRGLDAPLLNSLPVFAYSSLTHPHALECAVCLSEFEENEMGRELPKCHHSFHIDCIDMWFHSHSTCPVCRSPVEPESNIPPQNHQTDSGECEPGPSSGLAERRKGLDVRIEVPRRSEFEGELRLSSPASQDFRSPGSRLLSLRRILSMSRRTTVVSPSGATASSRGYVGAAESDVELGQRESTRGPTRAQTPR